MTRVSSSLAAGVAGVALLFAACGGGDDRISVSELSDTIQEEGEGDGITAEQADCLAEAFVDSDISDEGLNTIVENPDVDDVEALDLSDEDKEAATAVVESSFAADCFGIDSSTGETTDFGEPLEDDPEQADPGPGEQAGGEECAYLPTDAVASALGVDVEVTAASERACIFRSTDDSDLSLELNRIDILIDPEQYAEEARDLCDDGTVVDVDAGDRAYACVDFGPTGAYYQGDVLISMGSSFLADEDESLIFDAIVELLPEVTV